VDVPRRFEDDPPVGAFARLAGGFVLGDAHEGGVPRRVAAGPAAVVAEVEDAVRMLGVGRVGLGGVGGAPEVVAQATISYWAACAVAAQTTAVATQLSIRHRAIATGRRAVCPPVREDISLSLSVGPLAGVLGPY